jgi:hypothetical protein
LKGGDVALVRTVIGTHLHVADEIRTFGHEGVDVHLDLAKDQVQGFSRLAGRASVDVTLVGECRLRTTERRVESAFEREDGQERLIGFVRTNAMSNP